MKIAVLGCGAVGSFYGAALCRAGHAVHFVLRSDAEVVCRNGVRIMGPEGEWHVRPVGATTPEIVGPVDLVVIALKTTANGVLPQLLPPLMGPGTAVLTLQNGLGNEAEIARIVGADRVLGGLCFVCLNRIAPGRILHLAHGRIALGEYAGPARERTRAIAAWFREGGVPCDVMDNLERAHWEKLVWNIPFNGLGVASASGWDVFARPPGTPVRIVGPCRTTEELLAHPAWSVLVNELMHEVIRAARAQGLEVSWDLARTLTEQTRVMGPYRASTLLDFSRGQPLELETLFLRPQQAAWACGVAVPRLDRLCAVLRELDAVRATRGPGGEPPSP